MELYIKDGIVKKRDDIVIQGMVATPIGEEIVNIYNPLPETLLEHGWVLYKVIKDELIEAKNFKISEIKDWGESNEVDSFLYNGKEYWLDKDSRLGIQMRIDAEAIAGEVNTNVWLTDVYTKKLEMFTFNAFLFKQFLFELEVYASKCFDITHQCLNDIEGMNDENEVRNYDFKSKYPSKITLL